MKKYLILSNEHGFYESISKPIDGILVQDANGTRITGINEFDIIATVPGTCLVIESKYAKDYLLQQVTES